MCTYDSLYNTHIRTAPGLIVEAQPSTITVLDTAPYNTFSLVCTATLPPNVTAVKQFIWNRQDSSGSSTNFTSSAGTTITDLNLNSATSTSVLTTNVTTSGLFLFTCDVRALLSQSEVTTIVTVKGDMNLHVIMGI